MTELLSCNLWKLLFFKKNPMKMDPLVHCKLITPVYLQNIPRQAHQCKTSTTSSHGSSSEVTYGKHPLIICYIEEKHGYVTVLSKWTIVIAATHNFNSDVAEIVNTTYKNNKTTIYGFQFKFVTFYLSIYLFFLCIYCTVCIT
jgi:hypothetical protein